VSIAVMVLRRREPGLPRSFRVPLYPITPILSALGCLWIIKDLRPVTLLVFVGWVAVAMIWYFAYGIKHSTLGRHRPAGLLATPTGAADNAVTPTEHPFTPTDQKD
jgi:amino acid transporter